MLHMVDLFSELKGGVPFDEGLHFSDLLSVRLSLAGGVHSAIWGVLTSDQKIVKKKIKWMNEKDIFKME